MLEKIKKKKYIVFLLLIIFFIIWGIVLSYFWTQRIVEFIWTENTYIVIFLIALLWWFSSFTGYPLVTLMWTFIDWWSNPLLLWLCAWVWITFWDSLFYYFWSKWRDVIKWKYKKYVDKLSKWLEKRNKYFIPWFIFVYAWFLPLPNDILTISVSLTWYPFKKAFLPLIVWDIVHMILFAYLLYFWIDFFT